MNRRALLVRIALGLLIVLFLAFVWPTLWRYDHVQYKRQQLLVRINRLSGNVDALFPGSGWVAWTPR